MNHSIPRFPWMLLLLALCVPAVAESKTEVLVVVGAPGTEEFGRQFTEWAGRWEQAAENGKASFTAIGRSADATSEDREILKAWLSERAGESRDPLWLVLIGHGTFDGRSARFNLRGPDVSPRELGEWLLPVRRPMAIINCASSSGPFLAELSGPDRVVVTATKSGHEYNFARFGDHLSRAIVDPAADLDKDEQTSLLEAWLKASAAVREFYASESRLATEHALLDDNGDRLGTPPEWFEGVRVTKTPKANASPDGLRAGQWHLVRSAREETLTEAARHRRDELERNLATLRARKSELTEDDYLSQIEPLLVELARLYK